MESLAYLHLELANQQPEVQQNTDSNSIGDTWNAAGWDEIFDTLDEKDEEEEEVEPECTTDSQTDQNAKLLRRQARLHDPTIRLG